MTIHSQILQQLQSQLATPQADILVGKSAILVGEVVVDAVKGENAGGVKNSQ